MSARWRAFAAEADQSREASARIYAALKARAEDASAIATVEPLAWPLRGRITSRFGMRHGRMHDGVDLAAPIGTPVRAARAGEVVLAGDLLTYGNAVVLAHGSLLATVYAHLHHIDVAVGERVELQRVVGTVGMTGRTSGPHLHFEVRFDGEAVEPLVYLGGQGDGMVVAGSSPPHRA